MIIGIIGGNGVAATNKLLAIIEEKLTKNGAFRDAHHPEMLAFQATQAPSRSMFLEGRGESFVPAYVDIAKKLKSFGAAKLAMCCNTAHFAVDEISRSADIPFIDCIEATAKKALLMNPKEVVVICSDGAAKYKLYDKYLGTSVKIVYPNAETQALVTKGICSIKNTCRFLPESSPDNPANIFAEVERIFNPEKGRVLIMGCTDIGVVYASQNPNVVDSLSCLADAIVDEVQERLK